MTFLESSLFILVVGRGMRCVCHVIMWCLKTRIEKSYSIGINRFWFDGLVGFFRALLGKNLFRLVWLINFFKQPPCVIISRDCSSRKGYSHELPCFKRKRLEKCYLYQPKPVAVETVDPNRTRPKSMYVVPRILRTI